MSRKNQISDSDLGWLKESLLSINPTDIASDRRDIYSDKRIKFTSTDPGGMIYLNPLPQACRYTDLKVPNRLSRLGTGGDPISDDIYYDPDIRGLGNWYSQAIDDNAQVVHFRWGVMAFNDLSTFWSGFYNRDLSALARTGRVDDGLFSFIGRGFGAIFAIPFYPFIMVSKLWRFFTSSPSNKYWYVKPAMGLYWQAVSSMVNMTAVNLGLVPRFFMNDQKILADESLEGGGADRAEISRYMKILNSYLPAIFREDGGIDVYKYANRAARLAHHENERLREIANESSKEKMDARIREYINRPVENPDQRSRPIETALKDYMESDFGKARGSDDGFTSEKVPKEGVSGNEGRNFTDSGFLDLLEAEEADGSAFASFKVNHTGTVTESFTNSTSKPEIFDTVNERSRGARSKIMDFAGGNLGSGVVLGTAEAAIEALGDVVGGALQSVGLSGLAVAAGAAFVSTQEVWEESLATIPSQTYVIDLNAISSDPLSILLDIYVPLFALLAPALPRSTGSSSYTGPFVGELFDRGRCISRNTMIISATVERGTGDVGWSAHGLPLGVRVTIEVKDLNTMMSMPIAAEWSLNPLNMIFPDDSPFNDYMSVIGNLSMREVVYPLTGKLSLNLAKYAVGFRSWRSLSRWVNSGVNNTSLGRLWAGVNREFDRTN